MSPDFVNSFTLCILQTLSQRTPSEKPSYPSQINKQVINADLIPRMHESLSKAHLMQERTIPAPIIIKTQKDMTHLIKPIIQRRAMPMPQDFKLVEGKYGKLTVLIQDPTISSIECPGVGQNILIIRAGQKQFTKISMTPEEIKNILQTVAQEARVPLLEGVFRAAVENFVIHAVVSDIVGTRFIIKKQTPYSMLDKSNNTF